MGLKPNLQDPRPMPMRVLPPVLICSEILGLADALASVGYHALAGGRALAVDVMLAPGLQVLLALREICGVVLRVLDKLVSDGMFVLAFRMLCRSCARIQ